MGRKWIAGLAGFVLAAAAAGARGGGLPPVMEHLGMLTPTPAPTPEPAEHLRMITSFTLQNRPDGESIIAFEASDLAKTSKGTYRVLAAERYSLLDPKMKNSALRKRILKKIRDLEADLLAYVAEVGPPPLR